MLSTVVDVGRIVFFAIAVGPHDPDDDADGQPADDDHRPADEHLIYGVCALGFAAAAVRSVQVAIENWRRGFSLLERPEHAIEETIAR